MSRLISKECIKFHIEISLSTKRGFNFYGLCKALLPGLTTCSCPRKYAKMQKSFFEVVRRHLIINGMFPTYDVWSLHGEKSEMDMSRGP